MNGEKVTCSRWYSELQSMLLKNVSSTEEESALASISYRTLYQALADFEADLHQHNHL